MNRVQRLPLPEAPLPRSSSIQTPRDDLDSPFGPDPLSGQQVQRPDSSALHGRHRDSPHPRCHAP